MYLQVLLSILVMLKFTILNFFGVMRSCDLVTDNNKFNKVFFENISFLFSLYTYSKVRVNISTEARAITILF